MVTRQHGNKRVLVSIELFLLVGIIITISSVATGLSAGGSINTPTTPPKQTIDGCEYIDCVIVGGGPAGLATAIALTKASPSSSIAVFEKDNFQPKGASIQISKAGWTSLKELDDFDMKTTNTTSRKWNCWGGPRSHSHSLVSELKETSSPVTSVEFKPWTQHKQDKNLEKTKRRALKRYVSKITKSAMSSLFGLVLTSRGVHLWHDVRMALVDHAIHLYAEDTHHADGVPLLNPNCGLVNILENESNSNDEKYRFELTFQDPETGVERTVKAKYLFACDGTKSMVRSILPNEPSILLAENKSVWRGLAPNFDTKGKATFFRGVKDARTTTSGTSSESSTSTAGRSALIFPGGKQAGSSWTVISDVEDGKSSSMEEARRRVLKVIATMGQDNPDYKLLKQVIDDSNIVIENKLHVRDFENAPWESSYDGLVYIGDSAHPVRPTGEGTALAFEDANVLCKVVAECGLSKKALRKYEIERFIPVKTISEKIRANAENFYGVENTKEEAKKHLYTDRTSLAKTDMTNEGTLSD